jgi:subtilisin family serine protease
MAEPETELEFLPAWGLSKGTEREVEPAALPVPVSRGWAFGDGRGAGVRVCILDSGIEPDHPLVGGVQRSVAVERAGNGDLGVIGDESGDVAGHGTACAGIIRALAPDVELISVRVLGKDINGTFDALRAGFDWAIEERFELLNLSLSVRKREFVAELCELADRAAHQGTVAVCSAHNSPIESYPWRFASVVSVACHDEEDPELVYYNPTPPVEFFARGVGVPVAWIGGGTIRATGNSFATPHVTGLLARIRAAHPTLTTFELKTVLYRIAANVR